jgi:hypothetical protein
VDVTQVPTEVGLTAVGFITFATALIKRKSSL